MHLSVIKKLTGISHTHTQFICRRKRCKTNGISIRWHEDENTTIDYGIIVSVVPIRGKQLPLTRELRVNINYIRFTWGSRTIRLSLSDDKWATWSHNGNRRTFHRSKINSRLVLIPQEMSAWTAIFSTSVFRDGNSKTISRRQFICILLFI